MRHSHQSRPKRKYGGGGCLIPSTSTLGEEPEADVSIPLPAMSTFLSSGYCCHQRKYGSWGPPRRPFSSREPASRRPNGSQSPHGTGDVPHSSTSRIWALVTCIYTGIHTNSYAHTPRPVSSALPPQAPPRPTHNPSFVLHPRTLQERNRQK